TNHPEIMATPWFMFAVLGIYLFAITKLLPEVMEFRKPFELKKLIIVHNIVQVVSCIYVVHEILHITEGLIIYFWKCSILEQTPQRMKRHFSLAYFLFWLKISELMETIIFVLRRKQNQVTKLHIFHHISTVTLIYMLINHNETNVADKSIVRALMPVKKSITVMQMVQFTIMLIHSMLVLMNCGVDTKVFIYFICVIVLMFYGFYDFYKNTYNSSKRSKSDQSLAEQ
ncbi:GH22079, partial [Drosophila grimshawi]